MTNDFNGIARWYQFLSRAVFGKKLIQAQVVNLCYLEKNQKVLIVGGGDGELLKYIPTDLNLTIDYVDLSDSMIELAKPKAQGLNIKFFSGNILDHSGHYDVVIANFFFDCFGAKTVSSIVNHMNGFLLSDGLLMVTDFKLPRNWNQRRVQWAMHRFFKVVSHLESQKLADINQLIQQSGFCLESKQENKDLFAATYLKN